MIYGSQFCCFQGVLDLLGSSKNITNGSQHEPGAFRRSRGFHGQYHDTTYNCGSSHYIIFFIMFLFTIWVKTKEEKKNNYQWSHYGWIRPLGMCKKGFPQFPSQKCCQNHNFHKSSVGNPIPEPMPWAIWAPRIGPSHAIPNFKLFLGFTTWLCPKIRKIPPNSADSFEKTGSQPPDFGVFHGFPWFHHQICWVLL